MEGSGAPVPHDPDQVWINAMRVTPDRWLVSIYPYDPARVGVLATHRYADGVSSWAEAIEQARRSWRDMAVLR